MNEQTRQTVAEMLAQLIRRLTQVEYSIEQLQRAYPFHSLFFRDDAMIAFKRQRSIVTSLGQSLYPRLAEVLAKQRYTQVALDREFTGTVDSSTANAINHIMRDLREGRRKPDHCSEVREVLRAKGGRRRRIAVTADLFIGDFRGGPFFAEIKSPLPNLDVATESKQKVLTFIALHRRENPQAYLAFPYNPFVTREAYRWDPTSRIMDIQRQVLLGAEFWDTIAGDGTYDALLEVIEEVKRETPLT